MFLCGPIVRATATSAILIPERPKVQMGTGTHFSVVEGDVELGPVENEDWCAALVEFESGLKGTIELSRVIVGAEARYWFEVNGTHGAVAWNFERMNELEHYRDGGSARVAPDHWVYGAVRDAARVLGLDVTFWHDNGAYTPYGIIVPIVTATHRRTRQVVDANGQGPGSGASHQDIGLSERLGEI
jgi:predicted dehydrogenase